MWRSSTKRRLMPLGSRLISRELERFLVTRCGRDFSNACMDMYESSLTESLQGTEEMIHPSISIDIVRAIQLWSEQTRILGALAVVGSSTRSYVPKPANLDFLAVSFNSVTLPEV